MNAASLAHHMRVVHHWTADELEPIRERRPHLTLERLHQAEHDSGAWTHPIEDLSGSDWLPRAAGDIA